MRFTDIENSSPIKLSRILKQSVAIKRYFQKKPVDLVFVHGSLAKDDLKTLSDIDIALLFKEGCKDILKGISETMEKFSEWTGREDIDLMVLNSASPLACMQVLCNGKILYCRNSLVLKKFRLRTIQHYLATSYLRTTFNRYMEAAILKKAEKR